MKKARIKKLIPGLDQIIIMNGKLVAGSKHRAPYLQSCKSGVILSDRDKLKHRLEIKKQTRLDTRDYL